MTTYELAPTAFGNIGAIFISEYGDKIKHSR